MTAKTPDALTRLLDAGAEVVGGICYLDHKEVGRWANGEFYADPGHDELIEAAEKRQATAKAQVRENARLAAEAAKPAGKVGKSTTVEVPETAPKISTEDAATTQNSIPGQGPRNPVREDADNNRTPEVAPDAETASAEDVLRALDNLDGADAVKAGEKQAAGTGTELASTKGAGKSK